ncbi:hypothetical protein TVAG_362540 [Trichomonas vaginalis G3]|uniref:Initiator binding domain-containing protein n=1 Tax=Trichomonas vaginalis (strain ATCC PRA-98 / G3) TaxID=412133 RepID=A2E632_TRIV3|nr:hypothetical protein TVAGG3_0366140 [Trichomonas vaginalis G3]EAY11874.1 hypothetical protein TVAG_362540 [Trichomonas vaginalis G3]KAI5532285.1 hypothetical protein TVAGG3_0366140 [Trichomonas vaginalis G3]|eukprot:XP_001324097.1 hypothetical protein [Trichomonas vaginalis G3]
MENMEDVDDVLQELIDSLNGTRQMNFPERLFLCLEFIDRHPDYFDQVGAIWSDDGNDFVVYSDKLCHILRIKRNSLNKNFNMYGFKKLLLLDPPRFAKNKFKRSLLIRRTSSQFQFSRSTDFSTIRKAASLTTRFTSIKKKIEVTDDQGPLIRSSWLNLIGPKKKVTRDELVERIITGIIEDQGSSHYDAWKATITSLIENEELGFTEYMNFVKKYGVLSAAIKFFQTIISYDGIIEPWYGSSIKTGWNWCVYQYFPCRLKVCKRNRETIIIDHKFNGEFAVITAESGLVTSFSLKELLFDILKLENIEIANFDVEAEENDVEDNHLPKLEWEHIQSSPEYTDFSLHL